MRLVLRRVLWYSINMFEKKRIQAILVAGIAAVLCLALVAGILTFRFYRPVKTGGTISGDSLKGDRPASYTLETRNYFILRIRNYFARMIQVDPSYLHFTDTGDFLLKGLGEAGIPTDKVIAIADYFSRQEPDETIEKVMLAFVTERRDDNGEIIKGENGETQYVLDFNASPTFALGSLIGAETPQEFMESTLLTPDELGAFAYHAIWNGLSKEDRARLEGIGRDRFVNIFSGIARIWSNIDGFLNGSTATEARIMYELTYTVGRDLNVMVTVLGSETLERLFGVNPDAFRFEAASDDKEARKIREVFEAGQGLTAYSIQLLNAFLNGLTPEVFENYRRYTARGEKIDLLYAALLTGRNFEAAMKKAEETEGTLSAETVLQKLSKVTELAEELGKAESNAPYSLAEVLEKVKDFTAAGADITTKEDLQNETVYQSLDSRFSFFRSLNGTYEIKETTGANLLVTLSLFHALISALSAYQG